MALRGQRWRCPVGDDQLGQPLGAVADLGHLAHLEEPSKGRRAEREQARGDLPVTGEGGPVGVHLQAEAERIGRDQPLRQQVQQERIARAEHVRLRPGAVDHPPHVDRQRA